MTQAIRRFPLFTVLMLSILSSAACGGSSSETPTPIEPDLDRIRAQQKSQPRTAAREGEEWSSLPPDEEGDGALDEEPELMDTWGTSKSEPPSSDEVEAPF